MADDVWVIHPNLPPFDEGWGRDRAYLSDLGLDSETINAILLETCEQWWGQNWPGDPKTDPKGAGKRLAKGSLTGFTLGETPRSVVDNRGDRELIVYSSDVTIDEAMALVSPERVEKK